MARFAGGQLALLKDLGKPIMGFNVAAHPDSLGPLLPNRVLQARAWSTKEWINPATGELTGAPTETVRSGQYLFSVGAGNGYDSAGEYAIQWDGGPVSIASDLNIPALVRIGDRDYRFTLTPAPGMGNRSISFDWGNGVNPPTNLRVYRTSDADDLENGVPLVLEARNFFAASSVLRFMNLMSANGNNPLRLSSVGVKDLAPVGLDMLVDIANLLGISPWFCYNHTYTDEEVVAATDFICDNLNPDIPFIVEFGNESSWNIAFGPTKMLQRLGKALFSTIDSVDAGYNFYALRATQVAILVKQRFAAKGRRNGKLTYGGQATSVGAAKKGIDGALWRAWNADSYVSPPEVFDSFAIAPYIFNSMAKDEAIWPLLRDESEAAAMSYMVGLIDSTVAAKRSAVLSWKRYADEVGLELFIYEINQHITFGTTDVAHAVNMDYVEATVANPAAYIVGEEVTQETTGAHAPVAAITDTSILLDTRPLAESVKFGRAIDPPRALVGGTSGASQVPTAKLTTPAKPGCAEILQAFAFSAEMGAGLATHLQNCHDLGIPVMAFYSSYGGSSPFGYWGYTTQWGGTNERATALDNWRANNKRAALLRPEGKLLNLPAAFELVNIPICEPVLPSEAPAVGVPYSATLNARWSQLTDEVISSQWVLSADLSEIAGANSASLTADAALLGVAVKLRQRATIGAVEYTVYSQAKTVGAGPEEE